MLHENDDGVNPDEKNAASLEAEHPLTAEQLYMIDYQLYTPGSTMYNLFSVMKVDKELFDLEKLAGAMKTAIAAHPALCTAFGYNDDGELVQRYNPDSVPDIHVEKLTEFEFKFVKDTLVYPFKIIGGRLCRCRIFETEKAGYIFFDVHHSLFDGTSLKVFLGGVGKAYMGMPIENDYYYLMLKNREEAVHSDFYEESRKYFEDRYDHVEWSSYPVIDHESRDNEMGELFAPLGIEQPQMNAMERAYKISRNEFFITVAALAVSVYNNKNDIKLSWIYNGREDVQMMSSVGLLFRDLPVGIRFRDTDTLRDVFADVHDQVQKGIEHSCYPYVDLHNQVAKGESAYLLYQQDIRDMGSLEGFDIEPIEVRQNQAASQTILDMEILDGAEAFLLIQPGTDPADRPWKITELYNELLFRLPAIRQGEAHADHGNPVYMYYWRYPSSLPDLLACHAVELAYVFNNLDETVYTGEGINRKLVEEVQQMWVNFALTGNPSTEEHP